MGHASLRGRPCGVCRLPQALVGLGWRAPLWGRRRLPFRVKSRHKSRTLTMSALPPKADTNPHRPECLLSADCVAKLFLDGGDAILMRRHALLRNNDTSVSTYGFECCVEGEADGVLQHYLPIADIDHTGLSTGCQKHLWDM